jgi:hypothetical protein
VRASILAEFARKPDDGSKKRVTKRGRKRGRQK